MVRVSGFLRFHEQHEIREISSEISQLPRNSMKFRDFIKSQTKNNNYKVNKFLIEIRNNYVNSIKFDLYFCIFRDKSYIFFLILKYLVKIEVQCISCIYYNVYQDWAHLKLF